MRVWGSDSYALLFLSTYSPIIHFLRTLDMCAQMTRKIAKQIKLTWQALTILHTTINYYTITTVSRQWKTNQTRLHPFARSWLYNATAVRDALWWLRKSHIVYYAYHQHSPFARRRHDLRQAAARRFKLHFPQYRLVKVSWKSVQPFPRTVTSLIFLTDGKKTKNKQKTSAKHICIRLLPEGGCVNNGRQNAMSRNSVYCKLQSRLHVI